MLVFRSKRKLLKTATVVVLVISTLYTYSLMFTEVNKKANAIHGIREKQHAFDNPDHLSNKHVDQFRDPSFGMLNSRPVVADDSERFQKLSGDIGDKRLSIFADRNESQAAANDSPTVNINALHESKTEANANVDVDEKGEPFQPFNNLQNAHRQMLLKPNRKRVIYKRPNYTKTAAAQMDDRFYKNRRKRITPLDYKFIVKSQTCLDIQPPTFLVVLCISNFDHVHTRNVIRQTWGSVTKTKVWPIRNVNVSDVIVRFLLGSGELNATQMDAFRQEDSAYGDIIVSDFKDSYHNLTLKVLIGLKWVHTFCPHASYVLKIDEDTFLQMGNLISYLKTLESRPNGVMIGHVHADSLVLKWGKWALKRSVYPYTYYPPYAAGNSYVISTDIIKRLVAWSEYLPYVFIEDAAITGILRTAINATLLFDGGFTFHIRPPPRLCDFHSRNTTIKTATRTNNELKQKLWNTFSMSYPACRRHEVMERLNFRNQKGKLTLRSNNETTQS